MTTRELLAQLRRDGWTLVRHGSTSHQIWQAPNGERVPVPVKRSSESVSPTVVATIRRAARKAKT